MTLFQAYRDNNIDVIHAIRSLTDGKSPGPATKFCLSLGPKKCREVMYAARMHCHHDVVSAFKVLEPHSVDALNAWRNCTVTNGHDYFSACPRGGKPRLACSGNGRCVFERKGSRCNCDVGWSGHACDTWSGDLNGPGCLAQRIAAAARCSGHGKCSNMGVCRNV